MPASRSPWCAEHPLAPLPSSAKTFCQSRLRAAFFLMSRPEAAFDGRCAKRSDQEQAGLVILAGGDLTDDGSRIKPLRLEDRQHVRHGVSST